MGSDLTDPFTWSVPRVGVTDYLFNAGADLYISPPYYNFALRGPIGLDTRTRFAEITNGLSQMFGIGEAIGGNARNPFYAVGAGSNRTCVPLSSGYSYDGAYSYPSVYYDNLMFIERAKITSGEGFELDERRRNLPREHPRVVAETNRRNV